MKTIIVYFFFVSLALNLFAEEAELVNREPVQAHELDKTEWSVVRIHGEPVVEGSRTEFSFFEPGRIAATVGCNRIGGAVTMGVGTLSFGTLMMTRMACEEELMRQEQRFADALAAVTAYRMEEDGAVLILLAEDQERVRLVRRDMP